MFLFHWEENIILFNLSITFEKQKQNPSIKFSPGANTIYPSHSFIIVWSAVWFQVINNIPHETLLSYSALLSLRGFVFRTERSDWSLVLCLISNRSTDSSTLTMCSNSSASERVGSNTSRNLASAATFD